MPAAELLSTYTCSPCAAPDTVPVSYPELCSGPGSLHTPCYTRVCQFISVSPSVAEAPVPPVLYSVVECVVVLCEVEPVVFQFPRLLEVLKLHLVEGDLPLQGVHFLQNSVIKYHLRSTSTTKEPHYRPLLLPPRNTPGTRFPLSSSRSQREVMRASPFPEL